MRACRRRRGKGRLSGAGTFPRWMPFFGALRVSEIAPDGGRSQGRNRNLLGRSGPGSLHIVLCTSNAQLMHRLCKGRAQDRALSGVGGSGAGRGGLNPLPQGFRLARQARGPGAGDPTAGRTAPGRAGRRPEAVDSAIDRGGRASRADTATASAHAQRDEHLRSRSGRRNPRLRNQGGWQGLGVRRGRLNCASSARGAALVVCTGRFPTRLRVSGRLCGPPMWRGQSIEFRAISLISCARTAQERGSLPFLPCQNYPFV